jgi:1,5-anhydro-D-fructose reductase (1,5-anhydro-D-mannitol-forming)
MSVKFGVIGASGFGYNRSIPAFIEAEHFDLTALFARSLENLKKAADKFAVAEEDCYSDLDKFFENGGFDAVLISTPVSTHYDLVNTAIAYGKHVLCEKPLGMTSLEAEKMVRKAKDKGIKLGVAFHLRFHVLHQKAKELIKNGKMGHVNLIRMQNHMNYPQMENAWRQNPLLSGGGGPSIDVGSHHIDLMTYLLNSDVAEITAISANQVHQYDVEDIALILLKFENGTLGMIDLSWNTPNRLNVFEVYGSEASLYCERTVGPFKDPYGRLLEGDSVTEFKPEYRDTYTLEAEAFARWVEFDESYLIPGSEAVKNNKLLEAVNEAIRLGKTVKFNLINEAGR